MEMSDELLTEISYVNISKYRTNSNEVFGWGSIDTRQVNSYFITILTILFIPLLKFLIGIFIFCVYNLFNNNV